MEPLTKREEEYLAALCRMTLYRGRPPYFHEIGAEVGTKEPAAYSAMREIERKGYIVIMGGHRGIRLRPAGFEKFKEIIKREIH